MKANNGKSSSGRQPRFIDYVLNFIQEHKYILIIVAALFIQRLYSLKQYGIMYSLNSDDASYVTSGITFIKTGQITMHGTLSAQIMPGMPVFIGLLSLIFGEGKLLWLALKLCWMLMGSATAFFIYKSVVVFAPKACGLIASLGLFASNFVYVDNLILTETPFMFLLSVMVYSTIMMGRSEKKGYFWLCAISYMLALMLKANIGIYPAFVLIYLLMVKCDKKRLFRMSVTLIAMVLCFIIPWSIRNYIHFESFVPLTYGAGNPVLLGTYQGDGYPYDSELDYETNVEQVFKEKYAKYYDSSGEPREDYFRRYLSLEKDGIRAEYRQKVWFQRNPISFIKSYLYLKPQIMLEDVYYSRVNVIFDTSAQDIIDYRAIDLKFCLLALLAAVLVKKRRAVMAFLALLYFCNLYLYAMTYAFARYSDPLMILRFMMAGIGLYLIFDLFQLIWVRIRAYTKKEYPELPAELYGDGGSSKTGKN